MGRYRAGIQGRGVNAAWIRLLDEKSVELVFIRLSVRRSVWGTTIVAAGFLALLGARVLGG